METIAYDAFESVEIRAGTVVRAEPFPEARKPSIKLWIDFGELGTLTSSAQLTVLYTPEQLVGRQVVGVVNLGVRRIAGFESQCLVTGFERSAGEVVLIGPDSAVPNGSKLF
jgi:tRNA-binding protein